MRLDPTNVEFSKDGRVFVAEKSGLMSVMENVPPSTSLTTARAAVVLEALLRSTRAGIRPPGSAARRLLPRPKEGRSVRKIYGLAETRSPSTARSCA
jgi:hypothetical protein